MVADLRIALFSTLSGLVVHWTGRYRECLLIGWAVWAIGLGLLSTLDSPSLRKQIGYSLLAGFGLGNTLQPSLIAVQAGVERKHMAVVTVRHIPAPLRHYSSKADIEHSQHAISYATSAVP